MKLVIFDCDGTLVDSADEISANMRMTFEDHGGLQRAQSG